jgi:protein involved in polysaccharide export with SLBB domain
MVKQGLSVSRFFGAIAIAACAIPARFSRLARDAGRAFGALLAALTLLSSAAFAQSLAPAPAPAAEAPAPEIPGYVLGQGDRLRLIVFGEEDLSGEFIVDGSGRFAMPLVGEVQAAGLTQRQLERQIEGVLRSGYLNDPRVAIEIMNARPFYILGEVTRPGEYPYASGLTVFKAVATAGGFTPLANQTRVVIKRAGADEEVEVPLTGAASVQPGDTIRVLKGAFYILGEVNQAGEYPFSEGMTVQNAVAMARGFTYRAATGFVFLKRAGEMKEQRVKLTPDLLVQPGDTVRIVERFF